MKQTHGLRWSIASQAGRTLLQLLSIAILSRLLPPSDFGLMAMASVAVNFAGLFKDLGTSAAVIQRERIDRPFLDTVFWINAAVGACLALLVAILAPLLAKWFGADQLTTVLWALCPTFVIGSLGAIQQALSERNFEFKKLALIELGSAAVALCSAVICSFLGLGVISLVTMSITATSLTAMLLWGMGSWRPGRLDLSYRSEVLGRFVRNLTAFSLVSYVYRNVDNLLIGRSLGNELLGQYSIANRIMLIPLQTVTLATARTLTPALSRKQAVIEDLADFYFKYLSSVALLVSFIACGMYSLREDIVALFLSGQWGSVSLLLGWLAPAAFFQALTSSTGSVFMASGRVDTLLRLGCIGATLHVAGISMGLFWGVEGAAIGCMAASLINLAPCFSALLRLLKRTWAEIASATLRPLLAAVGAAASFEGLTHVLQFYSTGSLLTAALRTIALCLVFFVLSMMTCRPHVRALKQIATKE